MATEFCLLVDFPFTVMSCHVMETAARYPSVRSARYRSTTFFVLYVILMLYYWFRQKCDPIVGLHLSFLLPCMLMPTSITENSFNTMKII
jgi:hypothetical protein